MFPSRRQRRAPRFRPGVEGLETRTLLSFSSPTAFNALSRPTSLVATDFNGDGKNDLATANVNSTSASVLLGNGDGTFQAAVSYRVGSRPFAIAAGDLNRDGKADLVVANSNSNFDGNTVSVLLNKGDGTFTDPVAFGAGSGPAALAVADVNGDGNPDVLAANALSNTVSVLLGNGTGALQTAVHYAVGTQPRGLAVGDFNGDGRPDLAVANNLSNTLSVLINKGAGTFQPTPTQPTGIRPVALAVADLNGDGRADIVTANAGGVTSVGVTDRGGLSVFYGNGDGSFAPPTQLGTGPDPVGVVVADFDRDGRLDLATANAADNSVSLLTGKSGGAFHDAVSYAAGASPNFVAAADFTGDQYPDLVVPTAGATNLALLTNQFQAALGDGTPNQRFVGQVYLELLDRPVEAAGLVYWSGLLDRGSSRPDVVRQIETSEEYRTLRVRDMYRRLLGRDADAGGLATFVGFLGRGATLEKTEAQILGSEEYFLRQGGSNAGFLGALYRDALGRPIDATGSLAWSSQLTSAAARVSVAEAVLTSQEAQGQLVAGVYQRFLRRAPDSGGFQYFTTSLQRGLRDEQFIAFVVGSEEFFNRL